LKIKQAGDLNRKTVEEFRNSEKFPVIVLLENVRSMHNVGSVFRTADAFLISGIWLCGYTPRPPHRDIHKTALGATDTVPWRYFEQASDAVASLKEAGFAVYAVEQVETSIPLNEFSVEPAQKTAVVFGNEVSGVSPELLQGCSGSIEIPQFGMKHSLNVSVAAGIVLWHLAGRLTGR
jgi:23S rRNA (guanosine2251-2'-O)-methyltransferase